MQKHSVGALGAATKARRAALVLALLGSALHTGPAAAAEPAPAPATTAAAPRAVAEPAIQRTVIDEKGTRIEELRVRGQLQSVIVTPKGGAPAYEVIANSDGRDLTAEGKTNSRGSAGKRVWSVLRF